MHRFLAAFVILLKCVAAADGAELSVVSGPLPSGKIYVDCRIDGHNKRCFLDSGSALSLLAEDGSLKSYPSVGTLRFKSASGKVERVDTIQIRSLEVDGQLFPNLRVGRIAGGKAENTLGVDVLSRRPFTLRFRASPALELSPKRPALTAKNLALGQHGLLVIPVSWGETKRAAVWDTGAGITAVDRNFVERHRENFRPTRQKMEAIDGTGHPVKVERWRAKRLQIGDRKFRNVQVVVLDLGILREETHAEVEAVIGFNIIRKADWYFDTAHRSWAVH